MKSILIIILFIGLISSSCGNSASIPLSDRLTMEQKSAIKAEFPSVDLENVIKLRELALKALEKKELGGISYYDIIEVNLYGLDSSLIKEQDKKWSEEWKSSYFETHEKLDSLKKHYNSIKEEFHNALIVSKPTDIDKYYYSYIGGVKSVFIDLDVASSDTSITGVDAQIWVVSKADQEDFDTSLELNMDPYVGESCSLFGGVDDKYRDGHIVNLSSVPINCVVAPDYGDLSLAESCNINTISEKFNFNVIVNQIVKNGQKLTIEDVIPEIILNTYSSDKEIANELLDTEYMTNLKYINEKRTDYISTEFPKGYLVMEEIAQYNKKVIDKK